MAKKAPPGVRGNNPLNIRYAKQNKWQGRVEPPKVAGYETFQNMAFGFRAAAVLIVNKFDRLGVDNIDELILGVKRANGSRESGWAPAGVDGNPDTEYVDFVAKQTGFDPDERLNFHSYEDIAPVMAAMATFELGGDRWWRQEDLDRGLAMAGIEPADKVVIVEKAPPESVAKDAGVITSTAIGGTAVVGVAVEVLGQGEVVKRAAEGLVGSQYAMVAGLVAVAALGGMMLWRRLQRRRALRKARQGMARR